MRYRSAFNCRELLRVARKDLAKDDPEAHKVFLLALCAGLRRGEIDRLEWSAFDWGDQKLHIEITQHLALKSGDSVGAVDLEPQLIETFRDFHSRPTGSFVIESPRSARVGTTYLAYRCGHIFKRLAGWLRKHGVRAAKPLHTLRKEFGSQVCVGTAFLWPLWHCGIPISASHPIALLTITRRAD
jgi:integrase